VHEVDPRIQREQHVQIIATPCHGLPQEILPLVALLYSRLLRVRLKASVPEIVSLKMGQSEYSDIGFAA
jgi:hypothetical protein